MAEHQNKKHTEPSPLDINCSNACIRAGLAALLFSALAISMLQPLTHGKALDALLKYVSWRFALKEALGQLETDPCWEELTNRGSGAQESKEGGFNFLLEYRCEPKPRSSGIQPQVIEPSPYSWLYKDKAIKQSSMAGADTLWSISSFINLRYSYADVQPESPSVPQADTDPPATPQGLKITVPIFPIHEVVDLLSELGDGQVLMLARSFSYRYDRSIYNWETLRHKLIIKNKSKEIPVISIPSKGKTYFVRSYSRDELLKYLTLQDVRSLATYELPDLSEVEFLIKESGRISLPWTSSPLGLGSASTFVELAILLSLIHFWLFQREAQYSNFFPAPGTLFGAYNRTQISQRIFLFLITVPPASAVMLAFRSFDFAPSNGLFAFFTFLFLVSIAYEHRRVKNTGAEGGLSGGVKPGH